MAQAMCENGHPLQSGESTCRDCGGRIKMQWMEQSPTMKQVKQQTGVVATLGVLANAVTAVAAIALLVTYLLVQFTGIEEPDTQRLERAELSCTMDPAVHGGIYSEEFGNCVEAKLR